MKKFIIYAIILVVLASCTKTSSQATIIKDCTGNYIRISSVDYLVCNENVLLNYQENDKVQISFIEVKKCPELDGKIVCEMLHEYKSIIKILSIE